MEIIAAIDVGSHAIRMKIGEIKGNGDFRELETFRKVSTLGHDTFTNAKVSNESVEKVCDILKIFNNTMQDYGVTSYRALATSAIREASNRPYIIDQIKLKTGLEVKVIDNSEEQFITHKALRYKMSKYRNYIEEGAIIVVIGAGSIQITLYKNGSLISSQNIKMGALRIKEVIGSLENETIQYHKILDEYITVNFEGLDFFAQAKHLKHFIAVGGEIAFVNNIISKSGNQELQESITKKQFSELFHLLKDKSTEEIETELDIKRDRAEVLLPSMMLFKKILENTASEELIVPNISLTDGIIRDMYDDMTKLSIKDKPLDDIMSHVKILAEKFNYNIKHSEAVEKFSLLLFDKMKKVHGLENEKLLLRIAAILHDIGKYISLNQHAIHSYEIIRSLEIFGISRTQMNLIAHIAKYHSADTPSVRDRSFSMLSEKDQVLISKLVAIIRIADAMDRSHTQKIDIQQIKLKDKELLVRAVSAKNTKLEEWTFSTKAQFFEEVFGIVPILKIKKEIE